MNDEIKKEVHRLIEDCTYSSKGHHNAATLWNICHWLLGISTISLSAIASRMGGSPRLVYFALGASILAMISTFANPTNRSNSHKISGVDFKDLSTSARTFLNLKAPHLEEKEILDGLEKLLERQSKLNSRSLGIPFVAFWFAKRGIESGEAEYEVDK